MTDRASPKLRRWPAALAAIPPQIAGNLRRAYGRRRRLGDVTFSPHDQEVLATAEQANTVTAAVARLGIAALLAVLLFTFTPRTLVSFDLAATIVLINLALSILGVLLARWRRLRRILPSTLALLDVVFILSVMASFPHRAADVPGQFRPALLATWGMFLALALSTVRGTPGILALQTLLLAAGFFAVVQAAPMWPVGEPALAQAMALLFGSGYNAMRAVIILATGCVLAVAALRARTNLRHAIIGSRRAASLARYLAPTVAEIVAETEVAALRRGRQQDMAVLFADVRSFTAMSETLTPHEIASFLNEFRARATRAIEQSGGVIDKFIGDEVMGLFGLPLGTPKDCANAIAAARALMESLTSWNRERARTGLDAVRTGIGIHFGSVFIGVLGDDRLEFTVLGDTVNVARRLEQASKSVGHDFVVSSQVLEQAGEAATVDGRHWLPLPAQAIRGHREPVSIYADVTRQAAVGSVIG